MAKEVKVIIVNCDNNKDKVIEFFNGLFEVEHKESNNDIIYLIDDKDYHLDEMIKVLSYDLNANINIYESNIIKNSDIEINKIIALYDNNRLEGYVNSSILAKYLLDKKKIEDLKELKNILLSFIKEDNYYLSIIKGMFKNNLNVSKTASDVYMHRNTINNKLDDIEKKSGLNIQRFQDAYIMCYLLDL